MLTKELRTLEKYNLVEKEVYREVPPRVEYSLTDDGVKLYPLIENIIHFGETIGHLLAGTDVDLVTESIQKNSALKVKEFDLTAEPMALYQSKDLGSKESKIIEELLQTSDAVTTEDIPINSITHPEPTSIQDEDHPHVEEKSTLVSPNIGRKNAEILKKLKPEKKKTISLETNAIQLELF
jgi:DNA-binding PadR family transcriptional regulator